MMCVACECASGVCTVCECASGVYTACECASGVRTVGETRAYVDKDMREEESEGEPRARASEGKQSKIS